MKEKERLLAALHLQPVDRVPCVSHLQTGTVDLMKACGAFWPEANHDATKMVQLAWAAHEVAGLESVKVPFDVALDSTSFGVETGKEAVDRPPSILEPIVRSIEDAERLEMPDPHKDGRTPLVLEALRTLTTKTKETPIFGGVIAPFMLSGQMRGEQDAIMDVLLQPELIKTLLEITTEWCIVYAEAELEAGADVITLVDATASGTILSPEQYEEFAFPYQKRILEAIRSGGGRSILHICGDTSLNFDLMLETGANGISVDQLMDMHWVKQKTRGKCAAVGNVSPTTTLLFHSPEFVEEEVRECIADGTDILAPGCGFAPRTPLANMRAMVEAARRSLPG